MTTIQGATSRQAEAQTFGNDRSTDPASLPDALKTVAAAFGVSLPTSALDKLLQSASPLEALLAKSGLLDAFKPEVAAQKTAAQPSSVTVKSGDTLSSIAADAHTTLPRLLAANPQLARDPDLIRPGDVVHLGGASATHGYAVKSGDTLSGIAARNGTDVATLARLNGLADPDKLAVGQQLTIPGAGAPARADRAAPATAEASKPAAVAPTSTAPAASSSANGGVSASGMDFIYNHEAVKGVSNHLHWPKGGSGVTLGPGYDMKGASKADIVRDLTAVGVDKATAEKASQGAGLSGSAARDFAAANRDLINLTPAQERNLLSVTIKGYADAVRGDLKRPATQNQFDAMVSLAYNIGTGGFAGSSVLRNFNAGNVAAAAESFKLWNKSDGAVMQGLVNRRNDEVTLFNTSSAPMAAKPATPTPAAAPTAPVTGTPAARTPEGYAAQIAQHGDAQAKADLAAGKKVVVALRTDTSTTANGGKGVYDDTVAIVWKDPSGKLQMREFRGNTEPSSQYRFDGPKADRGSHTDMNGDGKADLGRLTAGSYRYAQQEGQFVGNTFFQATRTTPVERDTNQDGRFNASDSNRNDATGAGQSILIHQGGAENTWSAGCQTLPGADFNKFVSALGGQQSFSYVLTNAR